MKTWVAPYVQHLQHFERHVALAFGHIERAQRSLWRLHQRRPALDHAASELSDIARNLSVRASEIVQQAVRDAAERRAAYEAAHAHSDSPAPDMPPEANPNHGGPGAAPTGKPGEEG